MIDLLKGVREYVYPVGRLDFDSEGLLILTNDGDLAATLTHPRHEVERVYEAQVLGVPDEHDLDRLRRGLVIDGRRTSPAQIDLVTERTDRDVQEGRHVSPPRDDSRGAHAPGPQDGRRHRPSGAHAQAGPHRPDRRQEFEAGDIPGADGRGSAAAEERGTAAGRRESWGVGESGRVQRVRSRVRESERVRESKESVSLRLDQPSNNACKECE